MKLLVCLFYLCFRIDAEWTFTFSAINSSISFSSQLKLNRADLSRNKDIQNIKEYTSDTHPHQNDNVTKFQSDKSIRSRGLKTGKLFKENQDVMIMGSQFDIPENDEIIPLDDHISQVPISSKMQDISNVPLSLLKIKIWYDDGFLDHPDIKTTDKAESFIKTTLEHVQHNFCLSTLGTRLWVEVRHFRK